MGDVLSNDYFQIVETSYLVYPVFLKVEIELADWSCCDSVQN